ncbi:hypothetical protein RHMOL_Rhmol02G0249100 [Rhododendron molle]|uniref:Uncharacterized protein n=1 Tax=Rhododendron molle TaxID=49168 RepID=A0ACC0PWY8_RHOML|nr:hypothetical protein RHMOL_Rhmol02G0249100 [Rhododendron molle]
MLGGNLNHWGRGKRNNCRRGAPVWLQTPMPSPHLGRCICFRTGDDDANTTNLYSIPIDNGENDFAYPPSHNHHHHKGGGGEAVGLKPFNRSTIDIPVAFAAVRSSLFCIGGLEVSNEEEASRPWAEVFDPRTESYYPLPSPPSLGLLRHGFFGLVYAALHSSKRILVASPILNAAYVCNVVDGEWKQLDHNINFKGQVEEENILNKTSSLILSTFSLYLSQTKLPPKGGRRRLLPSSSWDLFFPFP